MGDSVMSELLNGYKSEIEKSIDAGWTAATYLMDELQMWNIQQAIKADEVSAEFLQVDVQRDGCELYLSWDGIVIVHVLCRDLKFYFWDHYADFDRENYPGMSPKPKEKHLVAVEDISEVLELLGKFSAKFHVGMISQQLDDFEMD